MNGLEIRDKINLSNKIIEKNLNKSTFVLNDEVAKAIKEIKQLQQICPHKFENNVCVYCGVSKDEQY